MTTQASKAVGPTGASFFRRSTSLCLAAGVLGGSLLVTAPGAQAADLGWTPEPSKAVVGSPSESGRNGHDFIAGLGVFPGQKVEYNIGVDLGVDEGAEEVTSLAVVDKLPAGFTVDQASIRIVGDNALTLSPRHDYTIGIKDGTLTLVFSDTWIAEHVGTEANAPMTRLTVSFTVTVAEDARPYSSQENVATQIVNGESFATPAATILVPGVDPLNIVTGDDDRPVGSRVAVGGDQLTYSVKLDGTFAADIPGEEGAEAQPTPLELAYDVNRFGILKDFDAESLDISKDDIVVRDRDGVDRTFLFDVEVKGGRLSVLAKASGDRDSVPEEVLSQDYTVEYKATVRDVDTNRTVVGQTVEVIDERKHPVASEPSVRVQAVAPTKAAVIPGVPGVEGVDGKIPADGSPVTEPIAPIEAIPEVVLDAVTENERFTYKLGSSSVPANRLTPVRSWHVVDTYTSGDRAMHDGWEVLADTDIVGTDGKVLIKEGDVIAHEGETKYFAASFSGDKVTVRATKAFLEAVNDDTEHSLGWSVYVEATRVAEPGTKVSNTSHEWSNGFDRSATATTNTDAAPVPEPTTPPVEAPSEQPTETPAPPAEDPKPEPTNPPKDEQPVEQPEPTTPPKDNPVEQPAPVTPPKDEQPVEKPVEDAKPEPTTPPKEQPVEKPVEEPTEKPVEKPQEEPVKAPADDSANKPSGDPTQPPAAEPTTAPTTPPSAAPKAAPAGDKGAPVDQIEGKMVAVTGESVSSTSPLLVGGGFAAVLASLVAGAVLMIRRSKAALSDKE